MQTCFTKELLSTMKMVPNKVLVKPTYGQHKINLGGTELHLDHRYAQEKHAPVSGTIINMFHEMKQELMPWHTKNELQVGDYVVYSYESAMYALEPLHGMVLFDEKAEPYFMIDYEDIFVGRRGEQIIPVNGYLLVSPVTENITDSPFAIPEQYRQMPSAKYGIVEHIGPANECYRAPQGAIRTDTYDIKEEIHPGDLVIFSEYSDLPVEYNIHKTIEGSKPLFRMQRRDLIHVQSIVQ